MGLPSGVTLVTNIKGDKGDTGSVAFADGEVVAADQPFEAEMVGTPDNVGVYFKVPRGLPGVNAVPAAEAVGTYLGAPDSAARAGFDAGIGRELSTRSSDAYSALAEVLAERGVNVKDFGAVGDGVTDDTAAVQAAVNSIPNGGALWFPDGDYFFNSTVFLPSNMRVSMAPSAWLRKRSTSATYSVFGCTGMGAGNFKRNLVFDGVQARGDLPGKGVCLLWAHRVDGVVFRNLRVEHATNGGHVLDLQGARNVVVEDSVFMGSAGDDTQIAETIQLDSSTRGGVSAVPPAGVVFDGTPTTDVIVRRCRFLKLTDGTGSYAAPRPIGVHSVVEGKWYRNITVTECYFEDVTPLTVWRNAVINLEACDNVEVFDNTFSFDVATTTPTGVNFWSANWRIPASDVNLPSHPAVNILDGGMRGLRLSVHGNRYINDAGVVEAWRNWVDVPITDTVNFAAWSDTTANMPRLFYANGVVTITGTFRCLTADYLLGTAARPICTIPAGLRPQFSLSWIAQNSTGFVVYAVDAISGVLSASRHSGASHASGLWLPVYAQWEVF